MYIKWLKSLKKHGKNGVEVTTLNGVKWLNEKNIEKQSGHVNLVAITSKYPEE